MLRRLRWRLKRALRRRKPEPCEVCGRRSKKNTTITASLTSDDPEVAGSLLAGFDVSATYCTDHLPEEHRHATAA